MQLIFGGEAICYRLAFSAMPVFGDPTQPVEQQEFAEASTRTIQLHTTMWIDRVHRCWRQRMFLGVLCSYSSLHVRVLWLWTERFCHSALCLCGLCCCCRGLGNDRRRCARSLAGAILVWSTLLNPASPRLPSFLPCSVLLTQG